MSRHFGGPGNFEQQFRKAETQQDLHMQAEIQRGYNQAGLACLIGCVIVLAAYYWAGSILAFLGNNLPWRFG